MARALHLVQLLLLVGLGIAAAQEGSANMAAACYTDPVTGACKEFERADADWRSDLDKVCASKPYLVGCSLYRQCQSSSSAASKVYCALPSLAANACLEAPGEPGCEAYAALCAASDGTKVRLCSVPGPVPDLMTAERAKAAIESICAKGCISGCGDCGAGTDWATCTDPLLTLAWTCRSSGKALAECGAAEGAGYNEMCVNMDTAMSFPRTCMKPLEPTAKCA